jgi:hypothetical protein
MAERGHRACTTCVHLLRKQIEALAIRENANIAAQTYGLPVRAIRRHMELHYGKTKDLPVYLPPPIEVRAAMPGAVVVEDQKPISIPNAYRQLDELRIRLFEIINAPEPAGNDGKDVPEWLIVQDKQYRLGAMRELRATITATLKLWEAQRALEERYSGTRPLNASTIASWLRDHYPDVLLELVEHLKSQRIAC